MGGGLREPSRAGACAAGCSAVVASVAAALLGGCVPQDAVALEVRQAAADAAAGARIEDDVLVLDLGARDVRSLHALLVERGLVEPDPVPARSVAREDGSAWDGEGESAEPGARASSTSRFRDSGFLPDGANDRSSDAESAEQQPVDDGPRDAQQRAANRGSKSADVPAELTLGEGDTLSELCSRELGSARHWQRVAAFNGWDEDDLLRLRAGRVVKVPPELRGPRVSAERATGSGNGTRR